MIDTFLRQHGWVDAKRLPLAGDASARRYTRLLRGADCAILMEDQAGDVALFARLARDLRSRGLSAPEILAQDTGLGLLLIEDLGDGLVARLSTSPDAERALYEAATQALAVLHAAPPPPDLPVADPQTLAAMTDLAFEYYAPEVDASQATKAALLPLLERYALPADVTILRDFHAENILDLPKRRGVARVGLLDFQDAMVGHRAYDLASLTRDARRDLFPGTAEACIRSYCALTGQQEAAFRTSLAVLGVQRNLRILGIFARLAQNGKPHYLDFLPRTWGHLRDDLSCPELEPVAQALRQLPAPDDTHIERLRSRCPTP